MPKEQASKTHMAAFQYPGLWLFLRLMIILIVTSLLICMVSGDKNISFNSAPEIEPEIIFPQDVQTINDEVKNSLFHAEQEVTYLLSIPAGERNEYNTIIRLEEILTKMDSSLLKYKALARLYPDKDLQSAAFMAAEKRNAFIRDIALNDDLYHLIKEVSPKSEYGRWLHAQEIKFFRVNGAGLTAEKRRELASLHLKLESLQNQHLKNIRENRSVTENIDILSETVILRNKIAALLGYPTWTDYIADLQGWEMNSTGISSLLNELTPLVKEWIQPLVAELLQKKQANNPEERFVYDYEVEPFIASLHRKSHPHERELSLPFHQVITRSLSLISCLLGVRTEQITDSSLYAPGVLLFRVSDEKTSETMGWFYLDLIDRAEKSGEWMTVMIAVDGSKEGGGGDVNLSGKPAPVFIVSGIVDESSGHPQFDKEDYTLLFHELGHVYTRILSVSGVSAQVPETLPVELTEASSHLFEYLAWTPEILCIMTAPDGLDSARKDCKTSEESAMNSPFSPKHLWSLGRDMTVSILEHQLMKTPGNISFGETYAGIFTEITGAKVTDEGGYLHGHPHFTGDNAGMYWIYPAGRLYGAMIYSKFADYGFFNQTTWYEFSKMILMPDGRGISAEDRMKRFLDTDNISIHEVKKRNSDLPVKIWTFIPDCIVRTKSLA
ncbi:MAG: oligopeptidase A [Euryarchaeota archaeon ADurb.Bin165]|jgi:Zn-dependent oligopeptidase|nr:MAG: oligopeptidase A [Euryarchaeota archaeon ADurb.Bin165]